MVAFGGGRRGGPGVVVVLVRDCVVLGYRGLGPGLGDGLGWTGLGRR